MDKNKLDVIIDLHKAQPVGDGYIDIIVSRENYDKFVRLIIENGFIIKGVSWWEWCPDEKEPEYGLGGPKSYYFKGWFAELPIDVDDVKTSESKKDLEKISEIVKLIETKSIFYPNDTVTFKHHDWLTPAIWLDVPDNWKNKYCA